MINLDYFKNLLNNKDTRSIPHSNILHDIHSEFSIENYDCKHILEETFTNIRHLKTVKIFFKIFKDLLLFLRDERYADIEKMWQSPNSLAVMFVINDLMGIYAALEYVVCVCRKKPEWFADKRLKSDVEEISHVLKLLTLRFYMFRKDDFLWFGKRVKKQYWDEKIVHDAKFYARKAHIPMEHFQGTFLGKKLEHLTSVQELLPTEEESCPICLDILDVKMDFAIMDNCKHLTCTKCLEALISSTSHKTK